jgi:putative DNA primase/helicase
MVDSVVPIGWIFLCDLDDHSPAKDKVNWFPGPSWEYFYTVMGGPIGPSGEFFKLNGNGKMNEIDPEKIKKYSKKVKQRVDSEKRAEREVTPKDPISANFILECLNENELGDGTLFIKLYKDKFVFDASSGEWMIWNEYHWKRDEVNEALVAVDAVAQNYIEEATRVAWRIAKENTKNNGQGNTDKLEKTQKELYRRAKKLRGETGRNHCLSFARANPNGSLAVVGDVFDQNPWLMPCSNGVVNLQTGELEPGRPGDYLRKASPARWEGLNTPAPTWEKFLKGIFQKNDNLIEYVQRLFGYGITGSVRENVLPILCGEGRNGKSVLVKTIHFVMGELASTVSSEMLLDQGRSRSSSAPSPDVMSLRGVRLAFASETEQGRRFATSRVKHLSGGDPLRGRNPHDKYEVEFLPTHLLLLMTNHKPQAAADDFAFWERVQLIPFNVKFISGRKSLNDDEKPADPELHEKLKAEASGILAWLVRGCLDWQKNKGLNPPAIVKDATAEYRSDEDILGEFLEECCWIDPQAEVKATEIYRRFEAWWVDNISNRPVSQIRFGKWMKRRFERIKRDVNIYLGVGLLLEEGEQTKFGSEP